MSKMRGTWRIFAVSAVVLMCISTSNAELLGVESIIGGQYPDIIFDNVGTIGYTASTDQFTLTADDLRIAFSPTEYYSLSGPSATTTMTVSLNVDQNGDMVGSGSMVEIVSDGDVTVRGQVYGAGTTLLSGSVYAFGWGESGDDLGDFDFLIDSVIGGRAVGTSAAPR